MGSTSSSAPISRRDLAYFRRRQQNLVFSALAKFFADEAAAGRINKKAIADKLGKDPAQITRWLAEPKNFELDTISDLLLAMGAEMQWNVVAVDQSAFDGLLAQETPKQVPARSAAE